MRPPLHRPAPPSRHEPVDYIHHKKLLDIDEQLAILAAKEAARPDDRRIAPERARLMAARFYWAGITLRSVWWDAIGRPEAAEHAREERARIRHAQGIFDGPPLDADAVERARRRLGEGDTP